MTTNNNNSDSGGNTLLAVIVGGLLIIVVAVFAFGGLAFNNGRTDRVAIDVHAPNAVNVPAPRVNLPNVNINTNRAPAPAQ
jgi:hypothetical protein